MTKAQGRRHNKKTGYYKNQFNRTLANKARRAAKRARHKLSAAEHAKARERADEPVGTDPCLRVDRGVEWFKFNDAWYQVSQDMPGRVLEGLRTERVRRATQQEKV